MIKKYILFILVITLSIVFAACGNSNNVNGTYEDGLKERMKSDDAFTLVLNDSLKYGNPVVNEDKYIEELETKLYKKGFNINIEVLPYSEYKSYVLDNIDSQDNIAFFNADFSKEEVLQLIKDNQIKELSADLVKYAPGYYSDKFTGELSKKTIKNNEMIYQNSNEEEIYGLPVGIVQALNSYAVLVRKDIADKYKENIDNLEDYEILLRYIKSEYPNEIPGLFPANVPMIFGFISKYQFIDFFAAVNGYSDISGLIGELWQRSLYFYNNTDTNNMSTDEDIEILSFNEIPGFRNYITNLSLWKDEGLVDYWTSKNYQYIDPTDYATIVTNTFLYMRSEFIIYDEVLVNADDYNMYLLNKEELIYSTRKLIEPFTSILYVNGNSKSSAEILCFVEWIYASQENYDLFMYGEEGLDYTIEDRKLCYIDGEQGRAYWGENILSYFKDFRYEGIKGYQPSNWDEVLGQISDIYDSRLLALSEKVEEAKGLAFNGILSINNEYLGDLSVNLAEDEIDSFFKSMEAISGDESKDIDTEYSELVDNLQNNEEFELGRKAYSDLVKAMLEYLE